MKTNQASKKNLYKDDEGFGQSNGWMFALWQKELMFEGVTSMNLCRYVKHRIMRHMITSQHKAWNDMVRMLINVDLISKDIKAKDGKLLL